MKGPVLILYDGHCLLCNRFITSIVAGDKSDSIHVAPLQVYHQLEPTSARPINKDVDSVVLLTKDEISYKSNAVLKLRMFQSRFGWFYRLVMFIPRFIRDWFYDIVARNRLSWFGQSETCIMPSVDSRKKYLMTEEELLVFLLGTKK